MADLTRRFPSPGDAPHEHNSLPSPGERNCQALAIFLALYVSSTKTCAAHEAAQSSRWDTFFVFDWQVEGSETTTLRSAHHHQAGPMCEKEIAALSATCCRPT